MRAASLLSISANCGRGFVLPTNKPAMESALTQGQTWSEDYHARHRRRI
jgi:hypothetical protein